MRVAHPGEGASGNRSAVELGCYGLHYQKWTKIRGGVNLRGAQMEERSDRHGYSGGLPQRFVSQKFTASQRSMDRPEGKRRQEEHLGDGIAKIPA